MPTQPVRLLTAVAVLLLLAALLGGLTGYAAACSQPPAVQVIARQYPLATYGWLQLASISF